ncbi:hypothetical protein BDD43_0015 [Mucilaginibacter gracilis]|uniref:Uncharacterized protein n=1 Tax=Mucilaginibacter gracilis TaxID=423350 RepID=A0A495IVN3_9SPHI|nr:hypothetical protein BDD43_0015 [Mucilaginibacter gracilis]
MIFFPKNGNTPKVIVALMSDRVAINSAILACSRKLVLYNTNGYKPV